LALFVWNSHVGYQAGPAAPCLLSSGFPTLIADLKVRGKKEEKEKKKKKKKSDRLDNRRKEIVAAAVHLTWVPLHGIKPP
jgi:hypothetical protein